MYHLHAIELHAAEQHTQLLRQAQQARLLRCARTLKRSSAHGQQSWWQKQLAVIISGWRYDGQPAAR